MDGGKTARKEREKNVGDGMIKKTEIRQLTKESHACIKEII